MSENELEESQPEETWLLKVKVFNGQTISPFLENAMNFWLDEHRDDIDVSHTIASANNIAVFYYEKK